MIGNCFWLIACIGLATINQGIAEENEHLTCEKIKIPFCEGIPYNFTGFPNALNHTTQAEAALEINKYQHILETGCSPDLKFLLCSLFLPMCREFEIRGGVPTKKGLLYAPCRSLCRRGAVPCESHMLQAGLVSSENGMGTCEDFPEFEKIGEHSLCVGEPDGEVDTTIKPSSQSGAKATGRTTFGSMETSLIFFILTMFHA